MSIYTDKMDDLFFNAYIECALWSSLDDNDEPMDGLYSVDDIADETIKELRKGAITFFNENIDLINNTPDFYNYEQAGHDLWLTQNGHGAGFWDRNIGDIGDKLTELAHIEGSIDLYIGDDGYIYK